MFWLSARAESKSNNGEAFITWICHYQGYDVASPSGLMLNCHTLCQKFWALEFCEEHNIHMVCLQIKTNRFQPSRIFEAVKLNYGNECIALMSKINSENKYVRKCTKPRAM